MFVECLSCVSVPFLSLQSLWEMLDPNFVFQWMVRVTQQVLIYVSMVPVKFDAEASSMFTRQFRIEVQLLVFNLFLIGHHLAD